MRVILHRSVQSSDVDLRRILADLGAKTRVLELMTHEDTNVRYQALITVQRLVSHPWASV